MNIDEGWWFSGYNRTTYKSRLQNPIARQPCFCIDCKRQWEEVKDAGFKKKRLYYYYNLPSYGKERKICPECEEK